MTPSDDLFNLVKSLSKNEKRFFKLYATNQGEEKSYMKLFEAIERQDQYDETSIKEQFKLEKKFLNTFSSWKNYLYSIILKSLRNYHAERSVNTQLASMYTDIEILYEKGLYEPCRKIISKAKMIALEHEKYPFFFLFVEYESDLPAESNNEIRKLNSFINNVLVGAIGASDKYRNELEHRMLEHSTLKVFFEHGASTIKSDEYKNLIKNKLLSGGYVAETVRAKNMLYSSHALLAKTIGDKQAEFNYRLKQLQLSEQHPAIMKENLLAYVLLLRDVFLHSITLEKHAICESIFKKMQDIRNSSSTVNLNALLISYLIDIEYYLKKTKNFKDAIKLIPIINDHLEKHKAMVPKHTSFQFFLCFSISYFCVENYKESLYWMNKMLNKYEFYKGEGYSFRRIFNLIIHYELGNDIFLEYDLRSTMKFLKPKDRLYKLWLLMIDFFSKELQEANTEEEKRRAFKELKIKLTGISKEKNFASVFKIFDFIAWADKKK